MRQLAFLVVPFFLLLSNFLIAQPTPATHDFPAADVRGFGTVGGTETDSTVDGRPGSVLTITCESDAKAQLVLAKFLSDEQCLPGVTKQPLPGSATPVTALQIEGQGWIAGMRVDSKVYIAAADTPTGLAQEISDALKGTTSPPVSEAEVQVPMWLDRWDQHGFRFYYAPWKTPMGVSTDAYNFRGDSTFAKSHGVGLVFWDDLSRAFGADGQSSRTFWDGVEKWAQQDNVPTAINLKALNYDIPTWLSNRYRDWMMQPMADYLGDSMSKAGWRGTSGKGGELAWGATPARDAMLGAVQMEVRHFVDQSNVVSWLEPHGELAQGGDDLMGVGPACDRTFRDYLQQHYKTVDDVSTAWTGQPGAFASWDAIHVPELAEFCGWGSDALDLAGTWHINSFTGNPTPDWLTPTFDDSAWLQVTAPGDDRDFTLPRQPAVYRRTVNVPADWLAAHPKSWIYLWDLSERSTGPEVAIYVNGTKVGSSPLRPTSTHWMTAEVSSELKAGTNQVSLVLPNGYIGYRVYISGEQPKQYPGLGAGMNQKWVDLVGWRQWTRVESVRRGMEMIREVDPNRGITLMAPTYAADGVKVLAQEYGGEFHDTGFMSGVFADLLPSLMRGSDLPFSLEPGSGPSTVPIFKRCLALWEIEGTQEISYFIHLGDVMWHPDILQQFEHDLPMIHLIGKYHVPKADLAFLWSTRDNALTRFPWSNDLNTNLASGWDWRGAYEAMLNYCPRDAISESDFANGYAAKYKVIIDTNTSIMDQAMIDQIANYARNGGIFVTMIQTGRHTPTQFDSWPIEQLTGYHVLTMERYDTLGRMAHPKPGDAIAGSDTQTSAPAAGQNVYTTHDAWMNSRFITGLRMQKVAPDAQDLVTWKDGTVAIGMRKIGKGAIIEFGCKSDGYRSGPGIDALEPILKWAGVQTNLADVSVPADPKAVNLHEYFFREFESNNGLYHVSTIWNPGTAPLAVTLSFHDKPAFADNVLSQQKIPLTDGQMNMTLDPLQLEMFLTPRNDLPHAGANWFDLQRKWWRAAKAITKPFPAPDQRFVRSMDDKWAWHPLDDKQQPDVAPAFDDSGWPRIDLGAWNTDPARADVHHAEMRRTFSVPPEWNNGTVRLWIETAGYPTFAYEGRIFLDGNSIGSSNWSRESEVHGADYGGTLTPGSNHLLTVEVRGKGVLNGLLGSAWIVYVPKPLSSVDLGGSWTTCKDDLFHDTSTVVLPGQYEGHSLWRTFDMPQEAAGKTIMLTEEADRPFQAYVNGRLVQYSGGPANNSHLGLNITPWIKPGQSNRIQLVSAFGKGKIDRLALDLYEPGTYP